VYLVLVAIDSTFLLERLEMLNMDQIETGLIVLPFPLLDKPSLQTGFTGFGIETLLGHCCKF